jgi:patatin-like phospholipase/acyl hydrolase
MKRILTIDGGGVRVYFPMLILQYIENKTNKKITDIFDFYSGVSASSIILSGLLTKYDLQESIKMFKELSKKIFYRSYSYIIKSGFGLFNSKYSDYYINETLKEIYNETKITDINKPFLILSYDIKKNKPALFKSYNNSDLLLWQIIRASTAAPTYFPPFINEDKILIDGGVAANNLSEITFLSAINHFNNKDDDYFQLSLGTGTFIKKATTIPYGYLSWAPKIIDVLFNASESYDFIELKKLMKIEKLEYNRLDIMLEKDIILDDYNSFDLMDNIFNSWLLENKDKLDKICSMLI